MIEPIGMIAVALGLACLLAGPRFAVATLVPLTLLGSATALSGPINLLPSVLLLAFVGVTVLTHGEEAAAFADSLRFPRPGFWLMCVTLFGVAGAMVVPRALAGVTDVYALASTDDALGTVPLGPTSGNVTQSIYMLADLTCFACVGAVARHRRGLDVVVRALVAYAVMNIAFAAIDLATYATGTSYLLGFIRNGQYTYHLDEEVNGMKRIAGSFLEASAFAGATLGVTAFTSRLWLAGRWTRTTGPLALVSIGLLLVSTSSTALVGIVPTLAALYLVALGMLRDRRRGRAALAVVVAAPALALFAVLLIATNEDAVRTLHEYLDALVFKKGASASGLERAAVNEAGLRNFVETYGIGGGLGSIRTSSFVVAVASNLGVVGLSLFAAFFACLFGGRGIDADGTDAVVADVRSAARLACFALLCGAATSGTLVMLGLPFYVYAGLACCRAGRARAGIAQEFAVVAPSAALRVEG